jgi:energy-coupling factor transporter ATP-binding protein EcfA2
MPDVPFRGIESFRFIDQQIFAERDDEVWDLQSKVTRYRAVLLYGESGTGKSSLINAGLIPSVIKKNLIVDRIRVQPTPGEELIIERISVTSDRKPPFLPSTFVTSEDSERVTLSVENFLSRLEELKKTTEPTANPQQAEDFEFKPQSRPLLIFDQFEEFITLFEPTSSVSGATSTLLGVSQSATSQPLTEAQQSMAQEQHKEALQSRTKALEETKKTQRKILDALVRLVQDESLRIKLLFVFREDYLAKLNLLFERVPDLLDQYLRLLPPSTDVVTKIIRAPFERLPGVFVNRLPDGLGTEISPTLAEQIKEKFIERSEGGPLNLSELEIVCRRLWESKNPESLFSQKQIGGVLEDYFSEKLSAFPDDLQEPAVGLLSLMITADNTRNIISESDLFSRVQKEEENVDLSRATKARDLLLGTRLVWRELRNGVYFYTIASDYLAKWIAKKKLERVSERELRKLAQQSELIKLSQQDAQLSSGLASPESQNKGGFDERAFRTRLKVAGTVELTHLVLRPTLEEERCLRVYFGDERYQELHRLALKSTSGSRAPKGNVVFIHGLMGSELSVFTSDKTTNSDLIWINAFRLMSGRLAWLKLNDNGRDGEFNIRASGVMKRYCGELILSLSEKWNVRAFVYDWRKDITLAAAELESQISTWFGEDAPVHLVAHDMGGLVARAFVKKYPRRWESMWDKQSGMQGRRGGRLIMLGTPNHGTFATPQMITGIDTTIKRITLLDIRHSSNDVLQIFNSFVGPYQMLPSPLVIPKAELLYESRTYGDLNVPQNRLDIAHKTHLLLKGVADPERMINIAGQNQPTLSNIKDYRRVNSADAYEMTLDGDGRVPHTLGLLRTPDGSSIPAYYIEEQHSNLPMNLKVIGALNSLLETGKTNELKELPMPKGKVSPKENKISARQIAATQASESEALFLLTRQARSVKSDSEQGGSFSEDERKIEDFITRGFLSENVKESHDAMLSAPFRMTNSIEIGLVYGRIESLPYENIKSKKGLPVDALAVGHYIGVLPQGPELMLDRALSGMKSDNGVAPPSASGDDLILTQYTQWGIIRGNLAQPFFLSDPRPTIGRTHSSKSDRVVAIAGMGIPGRFGYPELSVLAHRLCWSLGRLGKRHLACVLIGSGTGNLSVRDAVAGWIKGLKAALENSTDQKSRLERITFVEFDPRKIRNIQEALVNEIQQLNEKEDAELMIEYKELPAPQLDKLSEDEKEWDRKDWQRRKDDLERSSRPASTYLCVEMEGGTYRFGALGATGSTPERASSIDPSLIEAVNDELAGEQKPELLLERGRFLGQLLIPTDLNNQLTSNAPLVMVLDEATARLHWEMISPPDTLKSDAGKQRRGGANQVFMDGDFLGTSRGLTRQFPAMYSLPSEPPPPPRRTLRVLVVADPAPDAHLPGAQEEGVLVADLFESFNTVYETGLGKNRVEVVRLLGPLEATRTNVLRELMVRRYDVLYFAGHCVYQWNGDPAITGWIFNVGRKELLTANDLNRIDQIPKFIFSNASESGITPDRSQDRSVDLAPGFARMFLSRGVSNFVCSAWPVNDLSSRLFVQTLYAALLGLSVKEDGNGYTRAEPQEMYAAMRDARCALAVTPDGSTSWGAYQHYGSPFFQFFKTESPEESQSGSRKESGSAANKTPSKITRKTAKSVPSKTKAASKKSPVRRLRKARS